jgi:hypothetical protein
MALNRVMSWSVIVALQFRLLADIATVKPPCLAMKEPAA